MSGQTRSRCPTGWLSSGLPTLAGCGSLSVCSPSGTVTRRRSEGTAQLVVALPASPSLSARHRREHHMEHVIIGVDPHKLSATIEVVDQPRSCSARPVRHRPGRLRQRCGSTRRLGRIGSGRSRAPTASVAHWRSGSSKPVSRSSTYRPSSPPGCGCSTPATTARPTPRCALDRDRRGPPQGPAGAGGRRRARGAADARRPTRSAHPASGADREPAPASARRAAPRSGQEGPRPLAAKRSSPECAPRRRRDARRPIAATNSLN